MDPREAAALAAAQRRLSEPSWSEGGAPRWLEGRPEEGGRSVLVEHSAEGKTRILSPPGVSVRSRLHAYGGGSYCTGSRGDLFLVEDGSQHLLHLPRTGETRVHRPPRPGALGGLVWDGFHRRLLLVLETNEGDRLLAFHPGDGRWDVLHEEADFLMQPAADPGGRRLAWIAWDADVMPWERARLLVANLDTGGRLRGRPAVFGGEIAHLEPLFTPEGRLLVLADGGGRWRIERVEDGQTRPFVETEGEIGRPAWNAAVRHYGTVDEGTLLLVEIRGGASRLLRRDRDGGLRSLGHPFTEVADLATGPGRALVLAGAPGVPLCAARLDPSGETPKILASSLPGGLPEGAELPEPRRWSLPLRNDLPLHGWLYAPPGETPRPPPLVLRCHGGPTAAASPLFEPRLLLWHSLVAAVLDLNYRGSSGFGRAFRLALAGSWGRSDPADALRALVRLAREGAADPTRLALAGSSAGGLTVLRALERRAVSGAVLWYPVTDLAALEEEEVRFEKPYGAHLLDRNPENRRRLARLRTPRPRGGLLTTPLLVVQGRDDPVVPAHTTVAFVEDLHAHGGHADLHLLAGEGHGFRRGENLARLYALEASFLASVLHLHERTATGRR